MTPTLPRLIMSAIRNHTKTMFGGWLPGRIHAYDEATRKASVELLIDEVTYGEDAERKLEAYPIINEVPVLFPGSAGVRISWPISVGDTVMVVFAARSIDRWAQVGGTHVDPGDERDHDLNDAAVIPGLLDFAHVVNADPMIKFTSSEIQAGGTNALALNSKLSDLKTAIQNTVIVPKDGGASFKSTLLTALASWPGTGTTKLKGG